MFGIPPKRTCQIVSKLVCCEDLPEQGSNGYPLVQIGCEKNNGKSTRKRKRTCQIVPNDNLYWGVARPGYSLVQIHLGMRIAQSASGLSSKKKLTFWQNVIRWSQIAPFWWIEVMSEGQRLWQHTTTPQESDLIAHSLKKVLRRPDLYEGHDPFMIRSRK